MKAAKIISRKHQIFKDRAVLTVGKLYSPSSASFDFGGSEYREAKLKEIPVKKKRGDKYGWWSLSEGYYVMEFNEAVEVKKALLQPWGERFPASATHPARLLKGKNEKIRVILMVSKSGIKIKKNARFSELIEV